MLILGLLGIYFDAAVVFVTSQTLSFRLALAILWNRYSILYLIKGYFVDSREMDHAGRSFFEYFFMCKHGTLKKKIKNQTMNSKYT